MTDIAKELITSFLHGANLVIALVGLALIVGYAWWVFAKKPEQKKAKKIVKLSLIVVAVAGLAMLANHFHEQLAHIFPDDKSGVLVLRIEGDDDNSLQRDLVESLRRDLKSMQLTNNIIVWASNEKVDDTELDVTVANKASRRIGKKFRAQIVVWGSRVGVGKFWPHVTIVDPVSDSGLNWQPELGLQFLNDRSPLPPVLVCEPIYLACFVIGVSSFQTKHYDDALKFFQSALKFKDGNSAEAAPLRFFIATSRLISAETKSNPKEILNTAIAEFKSPANESVKTNSPANWVRIQGNLCAGLCQLAAYSQENEASNLLLEAISVYRTALTIYSDNHTTQDEAIIQYNLGLTLVEMAKRSRGTNAVELFTEAVNAFTASKVGFTREKFPWDWANVENNIGKALGEQARQNQNKMASDSFGEAANSFRAALEVYTFKRFPREWATAQNGLGIALRDQARQIQGGNAASISSQSVTAFRAVLEVRTRGQFPKEWADAQNDLGVALSDQARFSQGSDAPLLFNEALTAYRAALEVRTHETFPQDWAITQNNLGIALYQLARKSRGTNMLLLYREAVTAYRAALEIDRREKFPEEWAGTQNGLGSALAEQAQFSQKDEAAHLLSESITAFQSSLEIYTTDGFPALNRTASKNLSMSEQALHKLQE